MGLFSGGSQQVMSWKVSVDSSDMNKAQSNMKGMNSEAGKSPGLFQKIGGAMNSFVMGGFAVQMLTGIFTQLKNAVQDFMSQAMNAENQQAQLNAVLKSTHGMAGITIDDINGMAESLTRYTAFDDDAIRSSSALLLTFTSVGHGVFKRAQSDILDIATAMHEDLQTATIQVGKALQSAQGWTALKRIGVNISQQMLDTAQKLYATGHAAEAQNILLHELETEFGGSAAAAGKTFAGAMTILGNRIDDVKKAIGLALLPALTVLADTVVPAVESAIEHTQEAMKYWFDILGRAWHNLEPFFDAVKRIADVLFHDLRDALYSVIAPEVFEGLNKFDPIGAILSKLADAAQFVSDAIGPLKQYILRTGDAFWGFQDAVSTLAPILYDVADAISEIVTGKPLAVALSPATGSSKELAKSLGFDLVTALKNLQQPVSDIAHKMADVAHTVLPELKKAFGDLRVSGLLDVFKGLAKFILTNLGPILKGIAIYFAIAYGPIALLILGITKLVSWFKNLWATNKDFRQGIEGAGHAVGQFAEDIGKRLGPALKNIGMWINAAMKVIGPLWEAFWPHLQDVLQGVWNVIEGIVQIGWSIVSGIFKLVLDAFSGNMEQTKQDALDMFGGIIDGAKKILGGLIGIVWGILQGVGAVAAAGMQQLLGHISDGFHNILDSFGGIKDSFFKLGGDLIQAIVDGVKAAGNAVGTAVHNAVASIPGVAGHVPGFASGGLVGRGGLAMVGERGPEMVMLPTGARVYNNQETGQIAAASGGGSNTYNITVPPGANGALAGRQVVRAIQAYDAHQQWVRGKVRPVPVQVARG